MFRKTFLGAGMIAALVCLTACGGGNKQAETTPAETVPETAVAQDQTTTAPETTTTRAPEPTTTTKATEPPTTTKAPEPETTTKAPEPETEPANVVQNDDTADVYDDTEDIAEEAAEEYDGYYAVVAADGGLMLRSGPDSDYEFLTIVPDGTELEILETDEGWGYISYDGMEGWISLDYIQ